MKRPLARALMRLYAPSWQREYGCEFEELLLELPCTPALVADVVPRALATRKHIAAVLAAVLLLLSIAGSQVSRPRQPAQVAVRADVHRAALAPCRAYSSLSVSGITEKQQCLD
jgi:hypothetical protein